MVLLLGVPELKVSRIRGVVAVYRLKEDMIHLLYYTTEGKTVFVCGWNPPLMDGHAGMHIAWASDSVLSSGKICAMCHTEWVGALDSLEGWVRDEDHPHR